MLRRRKSDIRVSTNTTIWWNQVKKLLRKAGCRQDNGTTNTTEINIQTTTQMAESIKNRKAPGSVNMANEWIKYGGKRLMKELTKLQKNRTLTTNTQQLQRKYHSSNLQGKRKESPRNLQMFNPTKFNYEEVFKNLGIIRKNMRRTTGIWKKSIYTGCHLHNK